MFGFFFLSCFFAAYLRTSSQLCLLACLAWVSSFGSICLTKPLLYRRLPCNGTCAGAKIANLSRSCRLDPRRSMDPRCIHVRAVGRRFPSCNVGNKETGWGNAMDPRHVLLATCILLRTFAAPCPRHVHLVGLLLPSYDLGSTKGIGQCPSTPKSSSIRQAGGGMGYLPTYSCLGR